MRHVSGVPTYRSVKWWLNPLNHQFIFSGSHNTAGIPAIVYICTALIKNRTLRMINIRYKQNISHISFLMRSVAVKIIQFGSVINQSFKFHLLLAIKLPLCVAMKCIPTRYKDIGLCETSSKIYKVCGTCQFVAVRHGIIKCSWKNCRLKDTKFSVIFVNL
jgi:hypothetical protein